MRPEPFELACKAQIEGVIFHDLTTYDCGDNRGVLQGARVFIGLGFGFMIFRPVSPVLELDKTTLD